MQDKIIKLRKENGWSQEELAEKIDVSRQTISRWENGTALPDAQNVLQISKLFHVTTDYLLNDDYKSDNDIPVVQIATKDLYSKKKQHHLITAICFTVASFCWFMSISICVDDNQLLFSCFAFALCIVNAVVQFTLFAKKAKVAS